MIGISFSHSVEAWQTLHRSVGGLRCGTPQFVDYGGLESMVQDQGSASVVQFDAHLICFLFRAAGLDEVARKPRPVILGAVGGRFGGCGSVKVSMDEQFRVDIKAGA